MSNLKLTAIAVAALLFGGFGGRHLQSALDAEKIRGIETQARELEGRVKGLTQSIEGYEAVMADIQDARTRAIISYIDGLFAEFSTTDLCMTKEWWDHRKASMLPDEREADE